MSTYTSPNGAAIRAAIHELSSLMEDVDREDLLVYLPMHSEMSWTAKVVQEAQDRVEDTQ